MKKNIFILIFAFTVNGCLIAQTLLQSANLAFDREQYAKAIDFYKRALDHEKKTESIQSIYFKLGESYRFMNNMNEAKINFEQSYKNGNTTPLLYQRFAITLLETGNYNEAKKYAEEYLKTNPNDKKALQLISTCDFAIKQETDHLIRVRNEQKLNSPESDYGICKVKNKIFFASSRFDKENKKTFKFTGQAFSDFYESVFNEKNFSFDEPVRINGRINSDYNDGTLSFDEQNKILYFSQCNGQNGKKDFCGIYFSTYDDNKSEWTEPKELPASAGAYNIIHPSISKDGKTLYFVSDMPGGKGGKDIWRINKLNDDQWGTPVNLGSPVNTEFDEEFPHFYQDSVLYFASNGHEGFGGLDLYYSIYTNDTFSFPQNLKMPVNSSYDDFDLTFVTNGFGLFCSNRPGGSGDDDIYSFYYIQILIDGTITDDHNNPLEKATILLKGDDGSAFITYSNENGKYNIPNIKPEINYKIFSLKTGYKDDSTSLSTMHYIPQTDSTNFTFDFKLERIKLDTFAFDTATQIKLVKEKDIVKKVIVYYAYSKWNVLQKDKTELDFVAGYLKENPSFNVLLDAHTDERSSDTFNLKLSVKRAIYVADYLIKNGINSDRIAFKGWGKSNPVFKHASNETEHQSNRRTTFNFVYDEEFKSMINSEGYIAVSNNIAKKINSILTTNPYGTIPSETYSNQVKQKEDTQAPFITATVDYRVQIISSAVLVPPANYLKLETNIPDCKVIYTKDNTDNTYKYTIGSYKTYAEATNLLKKVRELGYSGFVVIYKNGQRMR